MRKKYLIMQKTDYGRIAGTYNKRYEANYLLNIENELKSLIAINNHKNILEAGCGTGRWIQSLYEKNLNIYGLDSSPEMLKILKENNSKLKVINADADFIPAKNNYFDLIFCINAIHHFPDKELFIKESFRILKSNGTVAVFGVDPHKDKEWYVYKYFDGVYENDLKRFPSNQQLVNLLKQNLFTEIEINIAEKVNEKRTGPEIFDDPFLVKNNCSQLANLTEQEYQTGINKIKKQIKTDPKTEFITSIIFYLIKAKKSYQE